MAVTVKYRFDTRNLPARLKTDLADNDPKNPQKLFVDAVAAELSGSFGVSTSDKITNAAVVGLLLLGENFDPESPTFNDAVRRSRDELLGKTTDFSGAPQPNKKIFEEIADIIPTLPGRGPTGNPAAASIFYQEFASAGRFVVANAAEIPLGHPLFSRQVERAEDNYVGGPAIFDSLELPPLTESAGAGVEIEPSNVQAAGMVYAAHQLESLGLFTTLDRVTEQFLNGQLPIGFEAGGRALDEYYWDREDRMNEAERRSVYSRVLGVKGGDVSKEVQPNTQFEGLFMRFLSSLAEYDRQQRIADIVQRNRPGNLTAEYVRKAGRDLAANLSLYGWAYTHFAARRLRIHIDQALNILKQPSIQKAYGATNVYQVIERVSSETGATPNIVKHRTMAEAGKSIIDIVAKHADKWVKSDGTPLFSEEIPVFNNNNFTTGFTAPDIPDADRDVLLRNTQYWLAVNGIKDDQVDKYAEPELTPYAPSLPSFGGFGGAPAPGAGGNGHGGGDQLEKVKQMVTQGQMPSLDQLQQMFTGKVGA